MHDPLRAEAPENMTFATWRGGTATRTSVCLFVNIRLHRPRGKDLLPVCGVMWCDVVYIVLHIAVHVYIVFDIVNVNMSGCSSGAHSTLLFYGAFWFLLAIYEGSLLP